MHSMGKLPPGAAKFWLSGAGCTSKEGPHSTSLLPALLLHPGRTQDGGGFRGRPFSRAILASESAPEFKYVDLYLSNILKELKSIKTIFFGWMLSYLAQVSGTRSKFSYILWQKFKATSQKYNSSSLWSCTILSNHRDKLILQTLGKYCEICPLGTMAICPRRIANTSQKCINKVFSTFITYPYFYCVLIYLKKNYPSDGNDVFYVGKEIINKTNSDRKK